MNALSVLAAMGFDAAGAAGQKILAKFCYEVYRKASVIRLEGTGKAPPHEWIDLTQREQGYWIAAVPDILSKGLQK